MPDSGQEPPAEPTAGEEPGHRRGGFFEALLKFRYVAAVVVILSLLHSLSFLVLAGRSALVTYWHVVAPPSDGGTQRPGLELLHSLDFLLVSLVLMILGLGVAKLFLLPHGSAQRPSRLPSWLDVGSFGELKYLLWETILTTLLVIALTSFSATIGQKLDWTSLVMPAGILLLALSLFLMKKA